jgi:hypothetical protein
MGEKFSGRRNCHWRAVYSDVVLGARGFYSGGVRDEGFLLRWCQGRGGFTMIG